MNPIFNEIMKVRKNVVTKLRSVPRANLPNMYEKLFMDKMIKSGQSIQKNKSKKQKKLNAKQHNKLMKMLPHN